MLDEWELGRSPSRGPGGRSPGGGVGTAPPRAVGFCGKGQEKWHFIDFQHGEAQVSFPHHLSNKLWQRMVGQLKSLMLLENDYGIQAQKSKTFFFM